MFVDVSADVTMEYGANSPAIALSDDVVVISDAGVFPEFGDANCVE